MAVQFECCLMMQILIWICKQINACTEAQSKYLHLITAFSRCARLVHAYDGKTAVI